MNISIGLPKLIVWISEYMKKVAVLSSWTLLSFKQAWNELFFKWLKHLKADTNIVIFSCKSQGLLLCLFRLQNILHDKCVKRLVMPSVNGYVDITSIKKTFTLKNLGKTILHTLL